MTNHAGQFFREKEQYVNEVCGAFIKPHQDFRTIECKHQGAEGICFMKLTDEADTATFFDISGKDMSEICTLVARIIAGEQTPELLTDYYQRKEVAKLFRN